ncbi:MAG: flagellar biosynthesis protein FlhB [Lachnospiraceae bacterium]|nr:flagellar biosynthesis protein FlhB [Lachnospiraceae bacterium]
MKLNLQLFAKEGPGGEKTEPASQKKLDDARKKGQVAKSKEIVNSAFLVIVFAFLDFYIGTMGEGFIESFNKFYNIIPKYAREVSDMNMQVALSVLGEVLSDILILIAPFLALAFIIYFIGDLVQVKWKISGEALKPKFSNLSPLNGFKRMFSKQSLINLLKSTAIVAICIYIVYTEIVENVFALYNLYDVSLTQAIAYCGDMALSIALDISIVYMFVGVADLIFQKRKFKQDMMMTKQEVKDEYKQSEGDPTVRQQIKRKMREVSQRRMMQKLPEADVVITNPTHFAVAIKYDLSIAKAPVVIAKGEDFLAQKIKEAAREHNIEIVENKPLARALYHSVDIDEEIPQELYQAVAEVLAVVYNTKKKPIPRGN